MKVTILEIGNYYDYPDITTIFLTRQKAINNIPIGFVKLNTPLDGKKYSYYESKLRERWLSIKEHEVIE